MPGASGKFDPRLLQARWVLGGIDGEQLVQQAVFALESGFDGTSLQQLAGLTGPTSREVGDLAERAFADLGLRRIGKDEALSYLLGCGEPHTHQVVSELRNAFPDFSGRWKEHVAWWGGNPAGSYNDIAEFVHFVVEDLYEKQRLDDIRRVFKLLEELFAEGDEEARNLIGLGFFETLQCVASWRPYDSKAFEEFLGPMSRQVWQEISRMWAGKSSLADVVRAERKRQ